VVGDFSETPHQTLKDKHIPRSLRKGGARLRLACPLPPGAAASVEFKLQGIGVTLCRHRFSFQNLVNALEKSILRDSENRCLLPLVKNAGYLCIGLTPLT